MSALPAQNDITNTATQGAAKTLFENLRDFISQSFGGDARTAVTLSSNSFTPAVRDHGGIFEVDTESAASTDDIDTIAVTNVEEGQCIFFYPASGARTLVVQHQQTSGNGDINLLDSLNYSMDEAYHGLMIQMRSNQWYELWRVGGVHAAKIAFGDAGSASAPELHIVGDTDTGLYQIAANRLGISTAGNKCAEFNADGALLLPLQPAFLAYNSSKDSNVTGDGTTATIDFNTEVFDQNADFASDTFTAPVTGIYQFNINVEFTGIDSSSDTVELNFVTSNRLHLFRVIDTNDLPTTMSCCYAIIADMDASDTLTITGEVTGGAKVVDISGSASIKTGISGCLIG